MLVFLFYVSEHNKKKRSDKLCSSVMGGRNICNCIMKSWNVMQTVTLQGVYRAKEKVSPLQTDLTKITLRSELLS